ncbi:MAG: CinA family protein [Hyphomicrobiaceae bacterium]|nr:CinA family protein [Hyphomicrobiaceae bacterium]
MFTPALLKRAEALLEICRSRGIRLVSAESCTGGLVSGLLTEIPGSSDVVDRGFVTYSNEAKSECLGVPVALVSKLGAVSRQVAAAMAQGALVRSRADIAVAITGVAGPGGGTDEKPVGLVFIAARDRKGGVAAREFRFGPLSRNEIRLASVNAALDLVEEVMR